MIRASTIERARSERVVSFPLGVAPEITDKVVEIVGACIPNLAFPVRDRARLRQDLGLSDDDRAKIERRIEQVFGVAAHGCSQSWFLVSDIARFVSVRLRRQKFLDREGGRSRFSSSAPEVAFRKIAPQSPLPWRVGEERHGGNVVIYDALGSELAVVGEWGGLTDLETSCIAVAIVTAVNAMGGVTPAEEEQARAALEGEG